MSPKVLLLAALISLSTIGVCGVASAQQVSERAVNNAPTTQPRGTPRSASQNVICGYFNSVYNSCQAGDPIVLETMANSGITSCAYFMNIMLRNGCREVWSYPAMEIIDGIIHPSDD